MKRPSWAVFLDTLSLAERGALVGRAGDTLIHVARVLERELQRRILAVPGISGAEFPHGKPTLGAGEPCSTLARGGSSWGVGCCPARHDPTAEAQLPAMRSHGILRPYRDDAAGPPLASTHARHVLGELYAGLAALPRPLPWRVLLALAATAITKGQEEK